MIKVTFTAQRPNTTKVSNFEVLLDPHDAFKSVPTESLTTACGLIPGFVFCEAGSTLSLAERCQKHYQFGLIPMLGGEVDLDGTYRYPEDPPLHPLLRIRDLTLSEDQAMFIYEHAIVSFVTGGEETLVVRMD